MKHEHIVKEVLTDSIAKELGIEPGDKLLSINDNEIEDVFDYHYYVNDEEIVLLIQKPDGEEWELEIEKDYEEDLGIVFEQGLMDEYRSCRNKCMFCFIDQMPKGMRDTLYFKDDDSRLSFLQGNYITLTNMSDHDIDRIVKYHLEPINISFHTTNPNFFYLQKMFHVKHHKTIPQALINDPAASCGVLSSAQVTYTPICYTASSPLIAYIFACTPFPVLVLSHIFLLSPHFHAHILLSHNSRLFKIPLPTVSFLLADIGQTPLLPLCFLLFVLSFSGYMLELTALKNVHGHDLFLSPGTLFHTAFLFLGMFPLLPYLLPRLLLLSDTFQDIQNDTLAPLHGVTCIYTHSSHNLLPFSFSISQFLL